MAYVLSMHTARSMHINIYIYIYIYIMHHTLVLCIASIMHTVSSSSPKSSMSMKHASMKDEA